MKTSGIYCYRNTITGKRYIGQSTDIVCRKKAHLYQLRRGSCNNDHLLGAYRKYGEKEFEFLVLEETQPDMLDFREKAWIRYYHSDDGRYGYNLESGGRRGHKDTSEIKRIKGSSFKGHHHSEESNMRNRLAHLGKRLAPEHRAKIGTSGLGRVVPTETRLRIARTLKGHNVPADTRAKISVSVKAGLSRERRLKMSVAQKRRFATVTVNP